MNPPVRKPDFNFSVMDTATGRKNTSIGAAWQNEDGSISIKLNPFVVLNGSESLALRLFKVGEYRTNAPGKNSPPSPIYDNDGSPF